MDPVQEPGAIVLSEGTMLEGGTLGMSWSFCFLTGGIDPRCVVFQCGPKLASPPIFFGY
jgi:hypothetical protein